ncbi:unnamed protein product [Nippostrongylus brasiliensis]|uniref:MMP-like protein (inferred by orthology to a C. elegans protein) n=1 Tax=Nippostrongylus brasiliensis TaxID=27835 RepID=A0A0N4YR06_NIPBR|nr:unnamed protein product [Nippostrongylus brasiliensis]
MAAETSSRLKLLRLAVFRDLGLSERSAEARRIWHKKVVTWAFRDPFRLLATDKTRQMVRSLISTAFTLWEDALNGSVKFYEEEFLSDDRNFLKPDVDIDILFAEGEHGDDEPFDSTGGMVAHSRYPPEGILHLDADEMWSFDGSNGVDLRYVIIHEIGHVLGLRHSKKKSSIMSKYYRSLDTGMKLPLADIASIRRLYRVKSERQDALRRSSKKPSF